MPNSPLVTIVIPTFNQASQVHKAIKSALWQDYPNLEVVVVDDCSTDNTPAVAQEYQNDPRFKYFRNQPNLGRVKNYKRALEEHATGDWIVNCDGDDYYTSSRFVSEMMELVAQPANERVMFAQAGQHVHFVNQPDHNYDSLPPIAQDIVLLQDGQYFWQYPHVGYFSHLTTLYRRQAAIAIDFYRYDIASTDRESFLRLALHGDVLLVKKIYATWVQHGANFSRKLDFETRQRNITWISGSYQYARTLLGASPKLEFWLKTCLTNYYKDWLSQVAIQEQPLLSKIKEIKKILGSTKFHHEIWRSGDFYKTLVSLFYKIL